MKGKKIPHRKVKPSVPHHFWLEDYCIWYCKNKHGCSNCKAAKRYNTKQSKRNKDNGDLLNG